MSLWTALPSLEMIADFSGMKNLMHSVLQGEVMSLFFGNQMAVQGWVYTGVLMSLVMSFISAAYVVVKTVDAGVSYTAPFIEGYAYTYRGGSVSWGDNLGLFELIALLLFSLWSLVMTIVALFGADSVWEQLEARVVGVKTEGQGGVALDDWVAIKIFTLTILVGITSLIGGCGLGDVADKLITWFDNYADDTKHTEGT